MALAEWAVGAGLAVTLLAGAAGAAGLLPAAMIPAEVEYRVATADGSLGQRGTVLDLLTPPRESPLLLWADQVFAGGTRRSTWPCATPCRRCALAATPVSPRAW